MRDAQFRTVVNNGDGGAFSRMVYKMKTDKALREIMKTRVRPDPGADRGGLHAQLKDTREDREWLSSKRLNTALFEPVHTGAQLSPTAPRPPMSPLGRIFDRQWAHGGVRHERAPPSQYAPR